MSALWDDDAYITECLSSGEAGRPPLGTAPSAERCHWCSHVLHGFPCSTCRCDNSFTSRDDSWRPVDDMSTSIAGQIRALANKCGVDGWTASAAIQNAASPSNTATEQAKTWRVRNYLLGLASAQPPTTPTAQRLEF